MTIRHIYFAGALFDHKALTGNLLLADAIKRQSAGRYVCVLPQNLEVSEARAKDIRDNDLKMVFDCDGALFNFDGTELDSGTVVEFMYAKMLDKPSVILRTDFRSGGDQLDGDPWNLMCSFYPRTATVLRNGMADYHGMRADGEDLLEILSSSYQKLAGELIAKLDEVFEQKSPLDASGLDRSVIELWAQRFPG